MADRNVSKSPRGSLSPDVFRSHPPSFEAAGQQHSGIGARLAVLRRRTRGSGLGRRGSVAGAHAHAHTYARVPSVAGTPHAHAHAPARMARTPTHPHARPPGRRPCTRPRAHAGPHAHALRPSCRRHDARKVGEIAPDRPPRRRGGGARPGPRPRQPALGRPPDPLDRAPGRDWPPICTGGSRHKRDASAENGTLAEFSGVSQYHCRTPRGDRATTGLFSVGPPGDGYPMATLLPILQRPPTRTRPYTRAR